MINLKSQISNVSIVCLQIMSVVRTIGVHFMKNPRSIGIGVRTLSGMLDTSKGENKWNLKYE